jgi:predicted RNA-binding Zn-ribbon protein involved in translation (DUF1610 family)
VRARVPARIVCAGATYDTRGKRTGGRCKKVAHPGCMTCNRVDPVVVEAHAQDLAARCRAGGWKLGPESEDGVFAHAMCPKCGRPSVEDLGLLRSLAASIGKS